MREFIGVKRQFRPWNSVATADAIWHFSLGIGDDNPLWLDETYAESTGWGGLISPPTFVASCATGGSTSKSGVSGEVDDFLPGVLGLWYNDKWVIDRPTRVGMALSATGELHHVEVIPDTGKGRRLLQVERHSFYGDGVLLAWCDKSILRFELSDSRRHNRIDQYVPPHYGEEDRKALRDQYDLEAGQRRGSRPLRAADVSVGDSLPRLVKGPLTISNMVGWLLGWGSLMAQTNRLQHAYLKEHPGAMVFDDNYGVEDTIEAPHFNNQLAQRAGLPAAYDFGVQRTAWLAHMLTDWCGDDGFVTELDVRLRRPNYLGDTLWLEGTVKAKRTDDISDLVVCELKAINQRDEVTASGTAEVRLGVAGRL
jgi:acyl dehydratase